MAKSDSRGEEGAKTVLQVLAILCFAGMRPMILGWRATP
jgi:hypothetical protein